MESMNNSNVVLIFTFVRVRHFKRCSPRTVNIYPLTFWLSAPWKCLATICVSQESHSKVFRRGWGGVQILEQLEHLLCFQCNGQGIITTPSKWPPGSTLSHPSWILFSSVKSESFQSLEFADSWLIWNVSFWLEEGILCQPMRWNNQSWFNWKF